MLRCAGTSFQSPLHRGSLWNKEVRDVMVSEGTLSVPSSSGKSLERKRSPRSRCKRKSFQSPLHRGSLWNRQDRRPRRRGEDLSVPSSSGKSLEPNTSMPCCPIVLAFQSPLHRGSLWNRAFVGCNPSALFSFSPLFIGEVSGTNPPASRVTLSIFLSVPSSSGKSLERTSSAV